MSKRFFSCILCILAVLTAVLSIPGFFTGWTASAASDSDITIETLRATLRSGAVKNGEGDFVWNADHSYADHRFTFRVSYAISGTYEHAPESVRIVIPKSILVNRNGVLSDYYEMSLPQENAEGLTDGNLYVYREEGDNLVIYNRLEVPAAQNGYFEVSYLTKERTFEYADYGASGTKNPKGGSEPFMASMTVVQDNVVKTKDSEKIPVYINTTAKITRTEKAYPTYYTAWQSSWGENPADADAWYYLVWEIRSYISEPTQPYNFTLEDDFTPYGEVLKYRFAGTSAYVDKSNNTVTNQKGNSAYGRYDYVLTRLNKAEYDALLAQDQKYTVINNVTATVDPVDQVDEDTSAKDSRQWSHGIPIWERPTGHFYMWKFGLDYRDAIVRSSEDIRRFDLDEFINPNIAVNTIEDLAYYTYVHGYPFPWTLGDGADPDDPASYGQKPVTWVLTDNNFNLKAMGGKYLGETPADPENPEAQPQKMKLSAEDYRVDSIKLDFGANDAVYSDSSKKFSAASPTYAADEVVIVSAEFGGSGDYSEVARWYPQTREWTITDPSLVSGTDGMNLTFNNSAANCTGYKLLTTNSHYYTRMGAWPHITLLDSETVRSVTDNLNEPKIAIRNIANSHVYRGETEGENSIISFTREGTDYVIGVIRHGNIEKKVTGYANSVVRREYTVTWSVNADESYLDEGHTRVPVKQESGVFYDLLPQGAVFKRDSLIAYADGKRLSAGKYEIETFANYKDSGRTLLKLSFNQSADLYAFSFSTLHSWDMIQAYGEALLNSVAYETGNADIGDGRPDDGGTGTDAALLRDLDPATDAEKFIYTQANHNIHVLQAASLGLYKKVMAEQDSDYSYETTTYQDSDYVYALHFATDSHTKASNLMLFDSLENYVVASGENAGDSSDWHGRLTAVDVRQPQELGIVPVIYYSTRENLDIAGLNINENYDFAASGVWTAADNFGTGLSSVKAVAVDLRYGTGGQSFELSPDTPVMVRLFMRSPENVESDKLDPVAYNNIYLHDTHTNVDTGASETELIHQDYTRLRYRVVADLDLSKADSTDPNVKVENIVFRLSGTSDYGTEIDEFRTTDADGHLRFENIERGTYILQEVDGVRDYLQDHTERTVVISPDGTVTLDGNAVTGPVEIPNDPRIHGDLRIEKRGTVDVHNGTIALEGATFLLEGVSDYGNEIEKYAVSDAAGTVLFEDVELGSYEMTEVEAAEGYILPQKTWRVVCDETGFVTLYDVNESGGTEPAALNAHGDPMIINEPLHKLLLKKYDETNPTIFLPGVEFSLTGTSDYGTMVDQTVTTDEFGTAHFEGLEPGRYVLKETKAPDHYEPDEQERLVTVSSDGTVTVEGLQFLTGDYAGYVGFPNARKYEGVVTITKAWDDNNAANRPILIMHLDTEEKTFVAPTATISKTKWKTDVNRVTDNDYSKTEPYFTNNGIPLLLRKAVSFTRNTALSLADVIALGAAKIDDDETDCSIYFWMDEDDNAYWWSDAEIVFFPEDSSSMFDGCFGLTELKLDEFNTSKVKNMNKLFRYCSNLEKLEVSTWDTSNVTSMSSVFYRLGDYQKGFANLDLTTWDTSSVTDMSYIFCNSFIENLNVSTWNTSSVKNLDYAFDYLPHLESLDISNWDVRNVESMFMTFSMFATYKEKSLDLSSWKTDSLTNMYNTFSSNHALKELDLSNWNVSKVTNMQGLFSGTSGLKKLNTTGWNTSNVKNVFAAFAEFSSDADFEWIGGNDWDLSSVTSVYEMFRGCSIKKLDLSKWNVSNLKSLSGMFKGNYSATSIEELDLSGWDISNVTSIDSTFGHLNGIKRIYVGDGWKTDQVTSSNGNFICTEWTCRNNSLVNLQGEKGTTWNASNPTDKTYARVDDPENGKPGYFWYKNTPIVTGHALTLADITETASEEKAIMPAAPEIPQLLPKDGENQNDTIAIHQVTNSSLWEASAGDEDPSKVFDRWVDNGDGTWTYRFRVFDQDSEYHVWEENIPGYTSPNMQHVAGAASIPLAYKQGGTQDPDPLVITNTKTTDEPNPAYGSLVIRKEVSGSIPSADHGRNFTLQLTLTSGTAGSPVSGRYGAYSFIEGQPTEITIRDGESITLSGIPQGTAYELSENAPEGYSVSYEGSTIGTISASAAVVTVKNEAQYGSLTLQKTLTAAEGAELTHADKTRKFAFDITLADSSFSGVHGGLVFSEGKATAWLADGEELTVDGLPPVGYTVSEQAQTGFIVTPAESSGTISKDGTSAAFTNEKQPVELGALKLSKTAPENHAEPFTFHLHFSGLQSHTEYDYSLNRTETTFTADGAGRAYLTLSLGNGQTAEFTDLAKDAKVSVAEDENEYIASYSVDEAPAVENRETNKTLSTGTLTISADQTLTVAFNNVTQEFPVTIRKLDLEHGYLADAVLAVLDAETETELMRWVSETEDRTITLPAGTYILRELMAPDGYDLTKTEDVRFSVSAEGMLTVEGSEEEYDYSVDMFNTPLPLWELILAKTVGGSYGTPERYFKMTVSLSALPDNIYRIDLSNADASISADEFDSRTRSNPETLVVAGGSGSVDLWLKDGQQVKISGLPNGTKVRVNEDAVDYSASWAIEGGNTGEGTDTGELILEQDSAVTITNTLDQEPLRITGSKTWDDSNDQDGHRPDSITIRLHANGADTGKFVTASEANGWSWTFENLDRTANGEPIEYTITEDAMHDYTAVYSIDRDGYNLTNRYTPGKTSLTVEKAWEDNGNQDGKRPESVTVKLLADGAETGKTCVLNETNHWECVFGELDEKAAGQTIVYSVIEDPVPDGYKAEIEGDPVKGYVITNVHAPEKTRIAGNKIWDDDNNRDGKRPGSITIHLHADGEHSGQSVKLPVTGDTAWSFEDLDKYSGGREIVYTVTEDAVDDYHTEIDQESFTITNRYTPGKTSLSVEKQWQDEADKDGIRPTAVRVNLLADNVVKQTAELNAGNKWFFEFTDLEEYENGERIVYTVEEVLTEVITGSDGEGTYAVRIEGDAAEGYTIVNVHTPAEEPEPEPEPEPKPEPPTPPVLFPIDVELPQTGLTGAPQAGKAAAVRYRRTGMELMIPSLGVSSEIVTVDAVDGQYPVESLGMDAGLLGGTALPGKGISVIAGHNTLNQEEYGPFALLTELRPGDRFFVRTNQGLTVFSIYANEKIGAMDGATLNELASRYENTLTLLTCEDERPEGGYASRRIVAAKAITE